MRAGLSGLPWAARSTNELAISYLRSTLQLCYSVVPWIALPESVAQDAMVHARRRYADELASAVDADVSPLQRQVLVCSKSFWDSFSLNVLALNSQRKRNWGLTCLAVSAGLINVILVCGRILLDICNSEHTHRDPLAACIIMLCTPFSSHLWTWVS